jgi:hypothetical protein
MSSTIDNNNQAQANVDKYKKKFEYADNIYKFFVSFIDKYGVMTVDWLGYSLGLNKEGKPLSEQSKEEIADNFKNLSEAMKNPEVREALLVTVKESEPVLKEAAFTFLNVAMSSAEFIIKDAIDIACHSDTIDPICGLFKVAEDSVQFGDDLVQSADGAVHTVNDAVEAVDHIKEELEHSKEKIHNATEQVSNAIQEPGNQLNNAIQNTSEQVNNAIQNTTQGVNNAIQNTSQQLIQEPGKQLNNAIQQKGGAEMLKKHKKINKTIENRIHQSLTHFFNLKQGKSKTNKTKTKKQSKGKHKRQSKTKSKR